MDLQSLPIDLERDGFVRHLIGELSGLLEEVVGIEEARGFIALVGQRVGSHLDGLYSAHLGEGDWTPEQLAAVLVDLKRRIHGGFRIESVDRSAIVLVNDACPFGARVVGRPSLCMMTSNVFGTLAAQHLGFASVALPETIARGDARCRVLVQFDVVASSAPDARQYSRA
jgi:predicted ArsR family transcriptional regulator